jgi:hypothetical protein
MAVFVLFSASTGARIVAAYFRRCADDGIGDNIAVVVEPAATAFFEAAPFVVYIPESIAFVIQRKINEFKTE